MDISNLTVHAAAIFIFPVRKIKFSSWEDILWHKKSLRQEAIGDNGHPAGLITIFL